MLKGVNSMATTRAAGSLRRQLAQCMVPPLRPGSTIAAVNGLRLPGKGMPVAAPTPTPMRKTTPTTKTTPTRHGVSASHWEERWSPDQLKSLSADHVMATWAPGSGFRNMPTLTHGEGCYVFDTDGNKYLDWTSQAICANFGYDMPVAVQEAASRQMAKLPVTYGCLANTEIRVRLSRLLSELLPEEINGFLFPTSGAEANEVAIRMARQFTGRPKVITYYKSYHGSSANSLAATGDFRRGFGEIGGGSAAGFVKTMNPTDEFFNIGTMGEERTARALSYLEQQIIGEGPNSIAAIMAESVVGGNGLYLAPPGYMEGVRALCDKYGILMIMDEVMVGFGRTGKMWGFQHYDVVPDIVTAAKGLTGAYAPLSMVATRNHIKEHFETNPLGWGGTFHAHPVSLTVGYECIKFLLEHDLVGRAKGVIEPVLREQIDKLVAKHPSVARGRVIGAFGCVDIVDPRTGAPIQSFDGSNCSNPLAVAAFKSALRENGIYGFVRLPAFHCAPALIIQPHELVDGFRRADRALEVFEAALRA